MQRFDSVEDVVARLAAETPVYCLCSALVARRARDFVARFPGRVLYAVKSNPLPSLLSTLWSAGVHDFDTASINEIELVARELPGARPWFMHPVKGREAIERAHQVHGVRHFVIDDASELDKLGEVLGSRDIVVVVRVATSGEGAFFNLSGKFGATPGVASALLGAVVARGYRAGLAFHVGSQCHAPAAFGSALRRCGEVLAAAAVSIECLDVGGGFPVAYAGERVPPLEDFVAAIEAGVAALALPAGCELLAEPGRALVAESMSLLTRVQMRRGESLYLNDGLHGGIGAPRIGIDLPVRALRVDGTLASATVDYTVYGPTCDGLDVLPRPLTLPADLGEGDWVEFQRVGAYSLPLRTAFNGFEDCQVVEVGEAPAAAE